MSFRIILNDFMKIVCGLKHGGASAVDGVIVTKKKPWETKLKKTCDFQVVHVWLVKRLDVNFISAL